MKSSLSIILLAIILLLMPLTATAAAPVVDGGVDFAALDAAVEAQMRKHGLPGVALAVVILMLIGTLPDYIQGVTKLGWALTAKKQSNAFATPDALRVSI